MNSFKGSVDGVVIATYRKGSFTWVCRKSNGFFCATFHNGRQSARTYFSKDANEINELIKKEILNGFRKVKH